MSRRPAATTQADIARILRAAKQVGAPGVVLRRGDVSVFIPFNTDCIRTLPDGASLLIEDKALEESEAIVL